MFLGDSGSLFIGLNFAVLTLAAPGGHASSNLISILAGPVLILVVPIVDTVLVTISRLVSGRSAVDGGRDHSSHRLVAIGLSERSAVAVLWSLAVLSGLLAVAIRNISNDWTGAVVALFLLGMIIFMVYLAHVRVYEDTDAARARLETGRFTPFALELMYKRRIAEVLLDLCLVSIAYYSAYRLRFEGGQWGVAFKSFIASLPIVVGLQMVALFVVGAYRGVWRYFGLMDAVVLARGVALGTRRQHLRRRVSVPVRQLLARGVRDLCRRLDAPADGIAGVVPADRRVHPQATRGRTAARHLRSRQWRVDGLERAAQWRFDELPDARVRR